ncbi:DUF1353 domain-containing protein [Pseudomonas fluorescens]|uniref:DUF1353 domain-containing protein n=1 Tax=Pseudomonas fluorescens TaxID=294 RepID=A0A5E7FNH5_PSEFL|nr:DUF1353 domain-containing protein [Pseudomonas fluorescens]VVO40710.1 hypothetical protein PS833_05797 [Pseudomonas fluorescens]
MSLREFGVFISLIITLSADSVLATENYGHYIGRVRAEWLENGRDMRLLEPFGYVDPSGKEWDAKAGSVVDGASIPKVAWSIVGGPFEGSYREASVIHDVACVQKNQRWQDVHQTFFTAMLASGVSMIRAKVMYAAVYHFGPRWPEVRLIKNISLGQSENEILSIKNNAPHDSDTKVIRIKSRDPSGNLTESLKVVLTPKPPTLNEAEFNELKSKIEKEDISLEAIEAFAPHPQ